MSIILRSHVFFRRQFIKRLNVFLTSVFIFLTCVNSFSQIDVTGNTDAQQLVQSILGKGYTVSNAKLTCPTSGGVFASGSFQNVSSNIGLNQGIVLTTGSINNIKGPNNQGGASQPNMQNGDADLDKLLTDSIKKTKDACGIEFDLVPACDEFKIKYVFASEEYLEYVNKSYNDIFAFFISGPGITGTMNIAKVPGTNSAVSINTINDKTNSQYYQDNDKGPSIQYDGFTKPISASIKVIPCSSYHLKIVIADVGDGSFDSGVFIEGGSINCIVPEVALPAACANKPTIQLCAPNGYTYQWPANQPGAVPPYDQQCLTINKPQAGVTYTVNMTQLGGGCPTTSNITLKGSDFSVRVTSVCLGAPKFPIKVTPLIKGNFNFKWEPATNLSCADCPDPVFDPISTQTYTITMSDVNDSSCNKERIVTIKVGTSLNVKTNDTTICDGGTATITATGADTYIWQPGNLSGATQQVSPTTTTTYTVTGSSASATCPGQSTAMAVVTVGQKVSVSAGADQTICVGSSASLGGSLGGAATGATWSGGTGTFLPDNKTPLASYTPSPSEILAGTVTLTLTTDSVGRCPVKSSQTIISITPPALVDAGPHQVICESSSATLAGVVSGGAISGTWTGGTGTFTPNSSANSSYKPSAAEIKAGKVILTFTSNDPPGPCPPVYDTMSIIINQKPVADAGAASEICEGAFIELAGKVSGGASTGTWTGGLGKYDPSNTSLAGKYVPTAAEIKAGKVTLTLLVNAVGLCSGDSSKVTHLIHPNPVVQFSVDTPKACPPHCINFYDSTTAGNTIVTKWEWKFGAEEVSAKNPTGICFKKPGLYDVQLTATSNKKCSTKLIKPFFIETYPQPQAQFTADPNPVSLYDPTIHFYDQSTTDVKSWVWSLGDGKIIAPSTKNPTYQYSVGFPTVYTVWLTVTNSYGCKDSTSQQVEVTPEFGFFIPNAFTPSEEADGINDTFFGKGKGIVDYQLWVFDRWGNMIFNTTDINKGWDGHVKGKSEIAIQDVYVWKVKLKDVFGKKHEYMGTVTLLKN